MQNSPDAEVAWYHKLQHTSDICHDRKIIQQKFSNTALRGCQYTNLSI